MSEKSFWDVLGEFGKVGIVGFLILVFAIWVFVHNSAQEGTEINIGFISYTKPVNSSRTENLLTVVSSMLIHHDMFIKYNDSCGNLKISNLEGESISVMATDLNLKSRKDGDVAYWKFNDSSKEITASSEPPSDIRIALLELSNLCTKH